MPPGAKGTPHGARPDPCRTAFGPSGAFSRATPAAL